MPVIHVEAEVRRPELLEAVEQLTPEEFQEFVEDVLRVRARRNGHSVSADESRLLIQINETLPEPQRVRYAELIARRQAGSLLPEEQAELIRLGDQSEELDARRTAALAELAQLRRVTLNELMRQLGLPGASDG